nr:hypothetical protein DM860_009168 [Ipomoea batatas]
MSPSACAPPVAVEDEEEDQGGVHPAMKAAVFACMAGAMIWTIAVANTAEELPNVDVPSEIALHLLITVMLLVCVAFLLAMVFVNCIRALGRFRKWRKTATLLRAGEKQRPLLV